MNPTTSSEQLKADLERLRSRLLDLGSRNPLLNYSHPRASSLRIVDEIPAIVLGALLANEGFRFAPLESPDETGVENAPERRAHGLERARLTAARVGEFPAANDSDDPMPQCQSDTERREARRKATAQREQKMRELAQRHGINPDYDLQAADRSDATSHTDQRLQTLLSPDDLEGRLQKIRAAAITGIQETGANLLHLLFGFVEWTDVPGGKPRMAPLVLLPVTLSRLELDARTHTYPYTVTASGEEWSANVTLQEKCRKDFGFVIPSVDLEENLETYFARIEAILAAQRLAWRVRRQLTLGLVSFGKILMWRDLDPATWPEDKPLLRNPLLREVLGTLATDEPEAAVETRGLEYNIDDLEPQHGVVPPIVVPADSSQHSVLIDVRRGQNLVVQGPPGTGKSQTITNIIADAIGQGKKVLFVAEKRTALEVVARRLAEVGLGPFCLPLHSHTSNKREFLNQLNARINLSAPGDSRAGLASVGALVSEVRAELSGHAKRLHAPLGSTGETAYTSFWRARRLAAEMPEKALGALRGESIPDAAGITRQQAAQHRSKLTAFAAAYEATVADGRPEDSHPWHGVSRSDLSFDDSEALLSAATRAHAAFAAAEQERERVERVMEGAAVPDSPDALLQLLGRIDQLKPPASLASSELIEAVQVRADWRAVRSAIDAVRLARRHWSRLQGPWSIPGAVSESMASEYAERLREAILTFGAGCTIDLAAALIDGANKAIQQLSAVQALTNSLAAELGVTPQLSIGLAIRLVELALEVSNLPDGVMALRSPALRAPNTGERIAALELRASLLIPLGQKLEEQFPAGVRPNLQKLREIVAGLAGAPVFLPSWFSSAYRRGVQEYRQMTGGRKASRSEMTAEIMGLVRYVSDHEAFVGEPALSLLFGAAADGTRSPFLLAKMLLEWATRALAAFRGTGEPGRALSEAVWSSSASAWSEVGALALSNSAGVASATALSLSLRQFEMSASGDFKEWWSLSFATVCERLTHRRTKAWTVVELARQAAVPGHASVSELRDILSTLREACAVAAAAEVHTDTFTKLGIDLRTLLSESGTDVMAALEAAQTYASQLEQAGLPSEVALWLSRGDQAKRLATLQQSARALRTVLTAAVSLEAALVQGGAVDLLQWYGTRSSTVSLTDRAIRLDRAIRGSSSLGRYLTLLRARAAIVTGPLPAASALLESGAIGGVQLADAYDYVLANTLSALVMRKHPELADFSGDLHDKRRAEFASRDEKFIRLTQEVIAQRASAAPQIRGVSGGQVRDLSEQSLIEHEIAKTRRHVPIREMFTRAGKAIQSLKPCIMMGPQAVAQYLPPGLFHFDLVIMDEASQIRPEDALGAVVRGSQLVVVGDPKQLGPTAFFASQSDEDEELDEAAEVLAAEAAGQEAPRGATVLERSESVLLAMARRYPLRMLRWHYRSRYPELIAFSNREFYNDDLVLFPHPGSERDGDKVNFRSVADGIYASPTNLAEARAVRDAVCRHAAESPERTLMVVTLNQRQKELIDKLIQDAEKDDVTLADFRARHQDTLEPFDVKNLESVQGDERDAIYVSVTFGPKDPNQRDKVGQNFGPINKLGGERRLNVLFTRAKYRLDVFCSFDPNVLRVTPASPRGLCVLRDYLLFAKEKTLDTGRFTGREPDSDFEIDVARTLGAHGIDVHPQVGVAGYFLDLAVVHPELPGRYILAVECDGATYHSAKSARDRDRLRQSVLEGLGWNVHRIWSTDWFRDPRTEALKVVRRVKQLLASSDTSEQLARRVAGGG